MIKVLKSKNDIEHFLDGFRESSHYDGQSNKHYFIFEDKKRNGQWTLMLNDRTKVWTIHGKGDNYCDPGEQPLGPSEVVRFIWKNRGSVNKALR